MSAFILQWWAQARQLTRTWTRVAVRSTYWVVGGGWTLLSHWRAVQRHPDYVIELIPPRAERDNALDTLALENLFQSLLLTAREPIALEIYGAPHERRLLARATSVRSLRHLCAQLHAHAPQVEVRQVSSPPAATVQYAPANLNLTSSSLTCDPLSFRAGERVRALELWLCGGAHLPLKLYQRDELSAQGVDPLLGVLAAMDGLPPNGHAVAQLALALAPSRWSRRQQRLAVEHPLAQEQARERAQLRATTANSLNGSGSSGATGLGALAPLALLALVGLALYTHLYPQAAGLHPERGAPLFPAVGIRLDPPHLLALVGSVTRPITHRIPLGLFLPLIIAVLALAFAALGLRARLAQTNIYSMRLVEERTTPIAARMRLTLIAMAPVSSIVANPPFIVHKASLSQTADEEQEPEKVRSQLAYGMRRVYACLNAHISAWIMTQRAHSAADAMLDQTLLQLVAAYRQHHLASGAYFVPHRPWAVWPMRFIPGWAQRARHSRDLLNVRELAALWHLPQGETETPLLERGRAQALLAPVTPLAQGYRIGHSTQANLSAPVRLPTEALRHNTLLVAKTGKGKSSLLLHLALAQLAAQDRDATPLSDTATLAAAAGKPRSHLDHREGLVVIDPHGDLVNTLLTLVPTARRNGVILVDLADTAYPVALNPLDALFGRDRDKAVESLLAVLSQIWAKFWGPRMQNALEYALKTLYEANETLIAHDPQHGPDQQFTLLDVAPILSAPGFRRDVLSLTQDQALRTWWTHYYQPLDFRLQLEIINPVLTKIAAFSGSRVARRIVGQGRSTLDLGEMVRSGQILLVNTAKGVVGAETATLIGATLLGALQASLEEQGRLAPEQRRHFLTIIDEFQTLLGVDYAALLSELRKFGGTFALATQTLAHLDTLDPTLRPTTLANVDALYAFAVSAEDARTLAHELDEVVTPVDLINQDDFRCYAKLTLAGRRLPVFSLALDPPPVGDPALAAQLRARARLRYARPLAVVEAALALAAARYLPLHEKTGATQDSQDTQTPMDDGSSQSDASQAREVRDEGATVSVTAVQKDTDMMSGIAPRTAQRGRFGRRPRAGGSRGKREGAPAFDLWTELLGDSEVVRQAASTNPETGDGEEVES